MSVLQPTGVPKGCLCNNGGLYQMDETIEACLDCKANIAVVGVMKVRLRVARYED